MRNTFLAFAITSTLFAQGSGYWHTQGSMILDANGQTVRIAGINWYGFETTDFVAHGLYAQDYKTILNDMHSLGYNTIRVPFSNQMVEQNPTPTNLTFGGGKNAELQGLNSLAILDRIVSYAGQIGLRIILDNHRSEAGNSAEDSCFWYTSAYPQSAWVNDWVSLANRYNGNSTVIGFDLRNEPHNNVTWGSGDPNTDWRLAAQTAGNQILAVNPHALIFVEGIQTYNGDSDWWGGNLEGAGQYPVLLNVPNQLVYSAHDYGPAVYGQQWFNGNTTSASLVAVWTKYWAYLSLNNIAPVWLGEFGTPNGASDQQNSAPGSEGQWFQSMVQFLSQNPNLSWTYWALNGEDSLGLLDGNYDATPQNATKQQMLGSIQFPLSGTQSNTPDFAVSASPASQTVTAGTVAQYIISITPRNGFTGAVAYTETGATASFNGSTLTTASTNPAGQYTITITATSGTISHNTTVQLTINSVPVPDFTLSATQTTVTINAQNGFNGTVALSLSGLPSGASAAFAPPTLSGSGSASLTITPGTAAPGSYSLLVTGTSGTLHHSAPLTYTIAPAQTGGGCLVTWQVFSDWGAGFVTGITITNKSATAINAWTLGFSFTGNQQITNLWNGVVTQSGSTVRVANQSYNSVIPANGTQQLGFQAAYSGNNQRPAAFTLNGQTCSSN